MWFDLNIKDSNVRSKLKEISEVLSELDLKTESGRKSAEKLFKNFNRENSKEIAEDFKNIAAQMGIQAQETANLSKRLKELSELKAGILRRDKEQSEHGNFVAMKNEAQAALDLTNRYNELAKLKEDILRRDKEMEAHGAFVTLVNESKQAQELNERYREMQQLKSAILERDRQSSEHGNFVAMKNEAQAAQELAARERELADLRNAIVRRNEEMIAAENRLREATERTNQARREAISISRKQAEFLVRDRVKELEAQRIQLQGLFGSGKNTLSTEDLARIRAAFSQITSELNTLRGAMANLSGYSIRDLFSMGRGTSDYSPLIRSMESAINQKQKAVDLERKHQQEIAQTGARIQSDLVRGFEKANSHAGKLNSTVQDLKSLFLQGGLVFGAQQFAMSIITTGGEMEKQHIALQSILGDMQNANTMFNQIKELALNSPFTFSELNRDVKQLAAYGVEYDQLYDTTKRLADMSSGLGVGFDRIALAFGQVQARGWLDGKELRQIAYAGIPLLDKLSQFYSKQEGRNVSTSEIKTRISNREVSFDDVKSIFWQMTDAGGQFYNMQQVLSETLLGRYNKLKDAWEIMLADFANGKNVIGGTFKGILDVVTNLVQQIHVLGPAMVAAFAGPALMRGVKTLEGGVGKRILNSKGNIAKEAELKLLRGEKITPVEKQILQYKNQIRIQDIQALAKANAITKAELRRLYVTGQITKEMYKQGMALTKQEGQVNRISLGGVLKGLASPSKWGAAGGLLLGGLKSGFSSIIGFLGGLPGIAISAGSAIFAYYWQKHQQLKQDMETTADELKDRYTQIGEFLRDNDVDKAIKDGDEKEIENLIDAYKEKLKEIAPEKENAFTMSLLEKKSNEDRLKYLKEQLILLKQVEESTQKSLSDEGTYKGFDEKLSSAKEIAEAFSSASTKANMINATQSDFASFNSWEEKYKNEVKAMRDYLIDELGDISNNPKLQGKANQILSSFFAKQGWDQDVSDQFRADVLNAMGVETGFYENKFKDALDNAVNTSFPWIGDKIRNNQELTDAEKTQVSNMMKDAAAQVKKDYPFASDALKQMLAADRFEAVIHLVFKNDDSDLTQQLEKNLKGSGYDYHEKN